jgi:large subunit ribosomal protein L21
VLVERLRAAEGEKVELDRVLLIADGKKTTIGTPLVKGARVVATSMGEEKGEKIIVFKYKPKVRYHHKTGHRQLYTKLNIQKILTKRETKKDGPQETGGRSQEQPGQPG